MSTILLPKTAPANSKGNRKSIFDYLEDPEATAVLPSLNSLVSELEALTQQRDSGLDRIAQIVRADQSTSIHVLRIANSAYYAPTNPIGDVQAAILFIGLSTLRGAVASTRCIEKTCHIRQDILPWPEFWVHAAGVGQMTMNLAYRLKLQSLPMESFYLMGLLHDIGKVVLACLMPEEFETIYLRSMIEKATPAALEVEVLGIEHGLLGAWYMERQGIPLPLREAVRFHHSGSLEDKPHFRHAALIRLADLLVLDSQIGQSGNHADLGDPFASAEWKWYLETCHVGKDDAAGLQTSIRRQLAQTADLVREIIPGASPAMAPTP